MHRAMLILLVGAFPRLQHFFRGWETPPTDPADAEDPVSNGAAFDEGKLRAITTIRNAAATFANDDELPLYVETPVRPQPGDRTHRDPNPELGIHNYLHNR